MPAPEAARVLRTVDVFLAQHLQERAYGMTLLGCPGGANGAANPL
jgi:hypothetical protein